MLYEKTCIHSFREFKEHHIPGMSRVLEIDQRQLGKGPQALSSAERVVMSAQRKETRKSRRDRKPHEARCQGQLAGWVRDPGALRHHLQARRKVICLCVLREEESTKVLRGQHGWPVPINDVWVSQRTTGFSCTSLCCLRPCNAHKVASF